MLFVLFFALFSVFFCSWPVVAGPVFTINQPLAPWKWMAIRDVPKIGRESSRSLCTNALPWVSYDPFISIAGPPGSSITVLGLWSDTEKPSSNAAQAVLGWSGPNLDSTLAHDVIIPSSGRACINITLPAWDTMTMGALAIVATEPGSKQRSFSCAAFEYLEQAPLASNFSFAQHTPSLRDIYCSANSTLSSSTSPCKCNCAIHGDLRCTGTCDKVQLTDAEKRCGRRNDSTSTAVSVSTLIAGLTVVAVFMTLL